MNMYNSNQTDISFFQYYWNFGNCEEELPKKPVGRQLAVCQPTVGRQLAVCRLTVARLSADSWPTVARLLANSWPTVGRQVLPEI